ADKAQRIQRLSQKELERLAYMTEGYSGADLTNLAKDASMQAIREFDTRRFSKISQDQIRPISFKDFEMAMKRIQPSVPKDSRAKYEAWNQRFGDAS
ncbi:unnamed protein product, partial [Notodromas monacha]